MFRRGVSLYSFQEEMFLGQMSVEDVVAFAASIGANGIELLPEQTMRGFPHITDRQVAEWKDLLDRHGCVPSCYDMFLDTKRHKGRLLSDDEQVESITRDIELAARLGYRDMRVLVFVRADILERCIPIAEKHDVRMGIEVHAPWYLDHAWILRTIEVAERTGTRHLGLVPDMGCFTKHFPPVFKGRFLRQGATPEIADHIVREYENRTLSEYVIYDVAVKMGGNKVDIAMAEQLRHNVYANPRRLLEFMPYIFHIQAKFYEVDAEYVDTSIDYASVIPLLIEGGYDGYLSSEYEGNRHIQDAFPVDSREQVRRQHVMFERLAESALQGREIA
jgi:sugar phosphate isomerase/epimerase